jgi:predicted RND superfamily exporter protein
MQPNVFETKAAAFYSKVIKWPKTIILSFVAVVGICFMSLPKMKIDNRVESYINEDNEALLTRNKVKEMFGLTDPFVIAVENEKGVFNPASLNLIAALSEESQQIKGVNPEKIVSIATEKNITGTVDGMDVSYFYDTKVESQAQADQIKDAVMDFPLYKGNLVSEDGTMALIVIETLNFDNDPSIYLQFDSLVKKYNTGSDQKIHLAGLGAVNAYLDTYIARDAMLMAPLSLLVLTIILLITFRTLRGMLLPNMIVIASVLCAMGIMAAAGIPFYTISNVIPVVIIVVSVAGAMHIIGQYYEEAALHPSETNKQLTIRTMVHMWRPVIATSVTNFAGFLSMSFTESSPPLRAVGIWSSTGLAFALLFSLLVLPACLSIIKVKRSKSYKASVETNSVKPDFFGRLMASMGRLVINYPKTVFTSFVLIAVVGAIGFNKLRINDTMVDNFEESEPVRMADVQMNAKMNGTNLIDIMIETPAKEGLYNPEVLKEIEKFQVFVKTLPNVRGSVSIIDFMKQMNKSLNENKKEAYSLPQSSDQTAQYFLLYSASSDPSDFANYVDYDYRYANIRVQMNDGHYETTKTVLNKVNEYIKNNLRSNKQLTASVGGWVSVHHAWINSIENNHFKGVALAMVLIWIISAIFFRSFIGGLFAMIPVGMAIYLVYAFMGFNNIWLSVATSMSATIASGDAIDFSMHTLDRIKYAIKNEGRTLDQALEVLYPTTGRVLFFNFIAIAFGFGALYFSKIPPLSTFCLLIIICIAACFILSMTLLPALLKTFKPKFLYK